ncbi:PilZ domain-containing protein [Methylomagnum ishizawai]|uniref:PilZ domain-containing protein n=1 Tax=Methylomagnum ishizawai TaxID=1760988 RepID=A0A1Y6CYY6_9GAMM|nr:PilZ domain-containing protein [Methylomagnum ishizawai]SMF95440.1 PilZ domain-containing protein [Methylomagnum ishizawai]
MDTEEALDPEADFPNTQGGTERERRRYFRIEEQVILSFKEISPREIPDLAGFQEITELPCNPFALASSLELLSQESRFLLRKIERDAPDIAEALRIIERKVDLVTRVFMSREPDLAECLPQEINLSASGLSFSIDQTYDPGRVLEIKMVLLPNMVGVIAYGRVIYCRRNVTLAGQPYRVGVDFIGLSDRDREMLIRHVVRRQSQILRGQKQNGQPPGRGSDGGYDPE